MEKNIKKNALICLIRVICVLRHFNNHIFGGLSPPPPRLCGWLLCSASALDIPANLLIL